MVGVYPLWKSQIQQIRFYLFNFPGGPVYQHTTGLTPRGTAQGLREGNYTLAILK